MPWNIETLNSLISFTHKAPLFSVLVQEHLSKMVRLNANTTTYLILLGLSSFLPHVLNIFGEKLPSPLSTPSTVFHPQLSKFKACSTPSFYTNPSMPLFPHDTSPDPSPILPIPPADSPVSPLAPPLAVDPVLD